jgi:hypothetical protein
MDINFQIHLLSTQLQEMGKYIEELEKANIILQGRLKEAGISLEPTNEETKEGEK